MDQNELNIILTKHKKWLNDEEGGECANLRSANLRDANLQYADTEGVICDETTTFYASQCPEEGAFIAYKKASGLIVKLLIPETAKRSSATTRKCRCDQAEVLEILKEDRTKADVTSVPSNRDEDFVYTVGDIVQVSDFDEDRWNECSTGIHFFITFDEAKNY